MTRIAALFVPFFPLAALLRRHPELAGKPAVVWEGDGASTRIAALSPSALQAGIQTGMSLAQARAIIPDLTTHRRDPACERSAHEALLKVADTISPRVEDMADDLVLASLSGLERRFPGPEGEAEIAAIAQRAASKFALAIRTGIAGSRLAARIAAQRPKAVTIVPAGGEASFLAPLPIQTLGLPISLERRLKLWGIVTLGALARLPAPDVAQRLGAAGAAAHRAARGEDPAPLVARHPEPVLMESTELEWPVLELEPLMHVTGELIRKLIRRLDENGAACALLEVELELDPGGIDRREIRLPAPSSDDRSLSGLVRLNLESHPPQAPITAVRCTAHPGRLRQAQLNLFGDAEMSPSELAGVLARAEARLGTGRAGSPCVANDHTPGAVRVVPFDPPPPPAVRPARRSRRLGLLAVRTLRPPIPIEVIVEGDGPAAQAPEARIRPAALRSLTGTRLHIQGMVRLAAGPWRYESGWWRETPLARDYWDVEVSDGCLYRIFCDRSTGSWYADGVYD